MFSKHCSNSLSASQYHKSSGKTPPPHAFVARIQSHPAFALLHEDEFVEHMLAHPVYCLASRISARRWEAMFRRHAAAPTQSHVPHWHVHGIVIGPRQRRAVLARGGFREVLVLKLMSFQTACRVGHPQALNLATRVVSRHRVLCFKNQTDSLFVEGQRFYGEGRYSEAAKSWGRAALLQHADSHAFLSNMLFEGRLDVPKDVKRACELASTGVSLGCAHSKGVLGRCLLQAPDIAGDSWGDTLMTGLGLGRESAAAGSCFGQFAVGHYFHVCALDDDEALRLYRLAADQGYAAAQHSLGVMISNGEGVAKDDAEAVRWYRLAAAQGHAGAQFNLGNMFDFGPGVAKDDAEAVRWYRLAAAQGHAGAQFNLGNMFDFGQGVAKDDAEAVRWYRLAAAQGHAGAQFNLGNMFAKGRGVSKDDAEAVRWWCLAAAQGHVSAQEFITRFQTKLSIPPEIVFKLMKQHGIRDGALLEEMEGSSTFDSLKAVANGAFNSVKDGASGWADTISKNMPDMSGVCRAVGKIVPDSFQRHLPD